MATTKDVKRLPSGKIEYRGETYPGFNKPKRNTGSDKHKQVVLAKKGDEIKVVKFGHKDYGHNYSAEARKNYLERSAGIRDGSGNLTKEEIESFHKEFVEKATKINNPHIQPELHRINGYLQGLYKKFKN